MSKGILSSGTWYTTSNNNELVGFQYSSNNMYYISYNLTHHQEVHRHKIFSRNFPTQNVKLNHYIAVFERVVLLCKICEQQTSNRIESLAIESGCIRE